MRTLRPLPKFFMISFLLVVIIVLLKSCEKPVDDDFYLEDSISSEELYPWQDLLQQLDLQSDILFVQEGESIQDVLDIANYGSVIYIEPGNYQEEISTNKTDIKLIGFSLAPDDLIIKNADKSNIEIVNLYDEKGFNDLQNRSFLSGVSSSSLINMTREDLGGNIAHYTFDIAMGPGEFDVITIHRVVMESRAYMPVRTAGDIFMVHGAIQDFDAIFLTAGAEIIDAKTSSPYYLASNKIDVWGIDMGWTKVPMGTTDFSFMEGWGIEKDARHTLNAMAIARLIRGLTKQGFSKMNLLGYSYGVHVVYGAANIEIQQNRFEQDVKGLIPVDNALKYDDENAQVNTCIAAFSKKKNLKNGQFVHPWGEGLIYLGNLALNAPDDASPFNGDLTNSQYLMAAGTQGFFAGNMDGYFYSDPQRFFKLCADLAPYWPMQLNYELSACPCPKEDVSYDDHLKQISLPILYIGAGLAEGHMGVYTSSLTSSTDITNHIVERYSHADLWFGYDADNFVWGPLSDWLKNHK